MAPAALWAALWASLWAAGLQLWAAGEPAQAIAPYAPESGSSCRQNDYYNEKAQMCCSMCPPGQHVEVYCTATSDTVCVPCESGTYTQVWTWLLKCLSCRSRCKADQVETQACLPDRDRICTCQPGWFCTLPRRESCSQCSLLRKCPPGFGVAKPGTASSNVQCAPCAPGTFSDTASSTAICRPHRKCHLVALPGNASRDAVCRTEFSPTITKVVSGPSLKPQPESSRPQYPEPTRPQILVPTAEPSLAPNISLLLPTDSNISVEEVSTDTLSLPIGLIVGLTVLSLVVIAVAKCIIMTQRKKKPFCLPGEVKVPHLPAADKALGTLGTEQRYLLTTAPSSSSSSLESSASTADRGPRAGKQLQAQRTRKAGATEARASTGSKDSSPSHQGTHVNVTCIVNVCGSSDHGSQCPSQAGSTAGDGNTSPSGSMKDQQLPFSREECPFQSQPGLLDMLLHTPEEKLLPLGVPDAGMKAS